MCCVFFCSSKRFTKFPPGPSLWQGVCVIDLLRHAHGFSFQRCRAFFFLLFNCCCRFSLCLPFWKFVDDTRFFFSFCKLTGFTNLCGDFLPGTICSAQFDTASAKNRRVLEHPANSRRHTAFAAVPQKHKHRVEWQQFLRGQFVLSHCSHYITGKTFPPTLCTRGHPEQCVICGHLEVFLLHSYKAHMWTSLINLSVSCFMFIAQQIEGNEIEMHCEPTTAIAVGIFYGRCISS